MTPGANPFPAAGASSASRHRHVWAVLILELSAGVPRLARPGCGAGLELPLLYLHSCHEQRQNPIALWGDTCPAFVLADSPLSKYSVGAKGFSAHLPLIHIPGAAPESESPKPGTLCPQLWDPLFWGAGICSRIRPSTQQALLVHTGSRDQAGWGFEQPGLVRGGVPMAGRWN